MKKNYSRLDAFFPLCRSIVDKDSFDKLISRSADHVLAESIPDLLEEKKSEFKLPDYINDLARFELACFKIASGEGEIPEYTANYKLNPSLTLLKMSWHIIPWIEGEKKSVEKGTVWAIVWRDRKSGEVLYQEAGKDVLMALKIAAEGLNIEQCEAEFNIKTGKIHSILSFAASKGIITGPMPLLTRGFSPYAEGLNALSSRDYHSAYTFTLTWHVSGTTSRENGIKRRKTDELAAAEKILDDLLSFCRNGNFRAHISFTSTSATPFSNHSFLDIYRMASERGFLLSIIAGPTSQKNLEEIVKIQKPDYYQIALKGLETPNDKGAFAKKMDFLAVLKELDIPSSVVICVTKENISEIIPLASRIREKVGSFTFSRMPQTWDPLADSGLPGKDEFQIFLSNYVSMSLENPVMGYKDNLINLELTRRGLRPFEGCCGTGCGAALCRMALYPDGEVHACPMFPSSIGNVFKKDFREIYGSEISDKYRRGPQECSSCKLRSHCGGCMSFTARMGLDRFKNADPYCFIDK
ncbi:MAG: selenobiotic family peptide radical SAM maturase [Lentisphaerae bacterium GWF2_45_14]|nr:MAG: selenobiotic family peptide radical SAM maturase [Lentisphaerae bacterium GWF2_45_14]